jgi:hypothetical protein
VRKPKRKRFGSSVDGKWRATRMKYGFCRVNRPVLDTPGTRIFSSTKAYREWCAENLPAYLGFQPAPME